MDRYTIILVDDEEEVRKSIIKKINWEEVGFTVVGDAENGEDALEKISALEPDVVLTDIRMPYMDGLTLTEKIHQKYPSMKVLIFSGYDDFEYAQKAIKLNVTEYILKPVNGEELTAILKKIHHNLDEEIEQKRDVSQLRESYLNSLPVMREHYLNDLVHGLVDRNQIGEKAREYGIDILDAKKWISAVVDVEPDETAVGRALSLHKERELIPISVRQLLEETVKGYCRCAFFHSSAQLAILAAVDEEQTQTGLIDVLGDVCKETKRILEVSITVGVGQSCSSLENLGRSFRSAMNALGYKAIVGAGHVIYINDVEPVSRGKLQFDTRDESELIAAIKFGPEEKIRDAVAAVSSKMDDAKVHFRQCQAYMLSVMNCITQLMQQYDLDLTEMLGFDGDYFEALSHIQNGEEFASWLLQVVLRMNQAVSQERDNTTRNVIRDAKQYIQDNYTNPDLSVEMLCRHLHMSPAYFSTMFKKETGQAYIAYLTEVRLNKAVELLNKTDDKTYVIASKVGYQEQNYFSYVFKKQFGVSPTKYRGAGK